MTRLILELSPGSAPAASAVSHLRAGAMLPADARAGSSPAVLPEPPKCTCRGWQQPCSPAGDPLSLHTGAGSSPAVLLESPQIHTPGLAAAPRSFWRPPNAHTRAGSSPTVLPEPPEMYTPGLAAAPQSQSPPQKQRPGLRVPTELAHRADTPLSSPLVLEGYGGINAAAKFILLFPRPFVSLKAL